MLTPVLGCNECFVFSQKIMSDNLAIKVAGVLSEIILEKNIENTFYYLKEKKYLPLSIECRLLKVKRNNQTLYVGYIYVIIEEIPLETCIISLDKQKFYSDILEDGQRLYNSALRLFELTDVYDISDGQQIRKVNGLNIIKPRLNEIINISL